MGCVELDRDQALFAINGHLGETVSVELLCASKRLDGLTAGMLMDFEGELRRLYSAERLASMPERERDLSAGIYTVGDQVIDLGAASGFIDWREDGINFHLAFNVLLALTWDAPLGPD